MLTRKRNINWPVIAAFAVNGLLWVIVLVAIVTLAGCNVYMSPDYQAKVQQATNTIDAMVKVCPDANHVDCCAGLAEASRTLHLVLDASYGRQAP